jgi:hypothetical protein
MSNGESISPTAHYTGYVWARNGLSHPELETVEGRLMYESLRVPMAAAEVLGRGTLERYLLARHRAIDLLLERAIERDGVTQVIEAAAGLSPRGWRFTERHPELVYIEGDLPGMVERKREALERMGSLSDRHRVVELDVLRPRGKGSLSGVARGLDKQAGLAIITEGLLSYLPRDAVDGAWESRPRRVHSGCCSLRSCAARSTCTSSAPRTPRMRCSRPDSAPRRCAPRPTCSGCNAKVPAARI